MLLIIHNDEAIDRESTIVYKSRRVSPEPSCPTRPLTCTHAISTAYSALALSSSMTSLASLFPIVALFATFTPAFFSSTAT